MELGAAVSLLLTISMSSLAFIFLWMRMCKSGKMPPGPTPLPVVGNLLQMKSGQIVKSLLKMRDIYGSVFTVYLGHRRTLVLCGYKAIKEALIGQGDAFLSRGTLPSWETIFHPSAIGVSNGEQWTQLRRFSIQTLKDFGMGKRSLEMLIQEEAEYLMKELRKTNEAPCDPTYMLICAPANIMFSIILGCRFDYEDKKFSRLLHSITEGFHIMSTSWGQLYDLFPKVMDYLPGTHQKMFKLFHYFKEYVGEIVKKHQETLDVNSPRDYICLFVCAKARRHQGATENNETNTTSNQQSRHILMNLGSQAPEDSTDGKQMRDTYGSVFTVYLGNRRTVVLCGYDTIKEAFIDHGDDFVSRGSLPAFETIFQGLGVGIVNGELWNQLRRFSLQTLRDFGMGKRSLEEQIQEEAQRLVKELRKTNQQPCDPTSLLILAPASVIFTIIVGVQFEYEDKRFNKLLYCISEGFHLISTFWGQVYDMFPKVMDHLPGPHQKIFKLMKYLEEFLLERVKINQETLDVNSPRDYIDCYLIRMEKEKQNPSSLFDIMNLVMTIMDIIFGGAETITLTLKHGLLLLLKNPEILEKVCREIDDVVGENRNPTTDDRNKMPFTNAVLHEIQRVSDIFPMGVPHCVTRDTPFRGYILKKGTDVFPMLTTSHHDPKKFHDPDNFNPENFLDEHGCFKKNDAFMPFFIGKRNCLGEGIARTELFLFLTNILKNFKIKPPNNLKDFEVGPVEVGFENMPPPYKLCFIPR